MVTHPGYKFSGDEVYTYDKLIIDVNIYNQATVRSPQAQYNVKPRTNHEGMEGDPHKGE